MKNFLGFCILLAIILLVLAIAMGCAAVLIGAVGAVFLHVPFGDAIHDAWRRPGMLLLFTVIVIPILALRRSQSL